MKSRNKHKACGGTDLFSAITIVLALVVILFIGSSIGAIVAGGLPAFAETIRQKEVPFALRLSAVTASCLILIVMAHILVNLPYAIRLIRTAFEASDQRMEFHCSNLGGFPLEVLPDHSPSPLSQKPYKYLYPDMVQGFGGIWSHPYVGRNYSF